MKVQIVTWLGNGEERIDYEGDARMLSADDAVHIRSIWFHKGTIKIAVNPECEFEVIGADVTAVGTCITLLPGGSRTKGNRPVYSGESGKVLRYV